MKDAAPPNSRKAASSERKMNKDLGTGALFLKQL